MGCKHSQLTNPQGTPGEKIQFFVRWRLTGNVTGRTQQHNLDIYNPFTKYQQDIPVWQMFSQNVGF